MTHSDGALSRWSKLYTRYQRQGLAGLAGWAGGWVYWNTGLWRVESLRRLRIAYKYRRRHKKYGIQYPIIVLQMGKVGSMSVFDALRASDLDVPVEHVHALNHLDEYEKGVRERLPDPRGPLNVIRHGRAVRESIDRGTWQGWNLISLVRAPVPRAISEFFYGLEWNIPNFETRFAREEPEVAELARLFIDEYRDYAPLAFFDHQVRELFGIDVYAEPFARERGYQIYTRGNARLLVMRLEDLDCVVATAMNEFLGIPNFALTRRNEGEKRAYGKLYKEFLARLRLPPARVDEWHSTKYARHFYTPEELAKSVARWT